MRSFPSGNERFVFRCAVSFFSKEEHDASIAWLPEATDRKPTGREAAVPQLEIAGVKHLL